MNKLEKKTEAFIKELAIKNGPPIYTLSPKEARKVLDTLQEIPVDKPMVKMQDLMLPVGPEGKVSVRIIRPNGNGNGNLPAILYCHGGGWILGNKHTHDNLIRKIACGAKAAVVFVNYTPAPEAKFPTQLEESYAVLKYISEHGSAMHLDTSRIAIVGDSVGGNMAAAVALLAQERGGPRIDYQVLFYPVTDANFNTGSYKEFAQGPWLTKASMEWFWNAYQPDHSMRNDPLVCPLKASLSRLKELPPALIIVDENDVLRDEGEAYAHKLMEAGVEVTSVRYLGTIHDFVMLNPLAETPASANAISQANGVLQKVFSGRKSVRQKRAA